MTASSHGLLVALGALALPIVLAAYFSFELTPNPPAWVGRSIAVVAVVAGLAHLGPEVARIVGKG